MTKTASHLFKGFADFIEIFRAGSHVDSAGRKCDFTTDDLDQMVANHALGAAPAVLGHPKHDDPAYGWVSDIKRVGNSLLAKFSDINPDFEAGVASGAYRNRSVSVFKDKDHGQRLRHVGWLGGALPAIAGLKPVQFAADEAHVHEFAAPGYSLVWGLEEAAKLLRSQREQMIADKGLDAADAALPQWRIDSILEACARAKQEFDDAEPDDAEPDDVTPEVGIANPLFTQATTTMTGVPMTFTQEDLNRTAAEAEAKAKLEAEAKFAATTAELATIKAAQRTDKAQVQIAGWKAIGKLFPNEEAGVAQFMARLDEAESHEFSATDGKTVKQTLAAFFADFVSRRTPLIKLGVQAMQASDAPAVDMHDASALAAAAQNYTAEQAAKGITISPTQAIDHIKRTAAAS